MASCGDEDNTNNFRNGLKSFINRADHMIMNFVSENKCPSALPNIAAGNQKAYSKPQESVNSFIGQIDNRSIGKELFQFIEENVESKLKTLIQSEVRSADSGRLDENLVNDCVENITLTDDYQMFEKGLCDSIDQISKHMRSECSSVSIELENVSSWTRASSDHVQTVFREEDDQSLSSSCSVDCWEMMNDERLQELSMSLDPQNSPHLQREALKILINSSVSELMTFSSWPFLKSQLQTLLVTNSSVIIFDSILQLHVKMMLSSSSVCVREGYSNVLESFYLRFQESQALVREKYFDVEENCTLLSLCKLIIVFQKTLPRYWTRFPEKHNESMVETTVSLFSDVFKTPHHHFNLLHVLAFLDPLAEWFKVWTTGEYGKKLLVAAFQKWPQIIPQFYSECMKLLNELKGNAGIFTQDRQRVSLKHMNYLLILHLINIFQSMFQSSRLCSLFDVQLENVTVDKCVNQMVELVSEFCSKVHACNRFCVGYSTVDLLSKYIEHRVGSKGSILDEDILLSLRQWADSCGPDEWSDIMENDVHSLSHLSDCLLTLTDQSDVLQLITNEIENDSDVTLMDTIMSVTEKLLLTTTEKLENLSGLENVKNKFIKVTCRLCSVHNGINRMLLRGLQLLRVIAEEWELMLQQGETTPVPGECSGNKSHPNALLKLKEIKSVGHTTIGVSVLQEVGLLFDLVNAVEIHCDISYDDLLLFSQVATIASTSSVLYPILDLLANNLWCLISEEIIADDNLESGINRLFSKLIAIIPSSYLMRSSILFSIDPSELLGVNRLLAAGIKGYQACMCSELACESGLQLLVILCSDLDCWLQIQSDHNLKECLINCQKAMMDEESVDQPYVNQMTLLRNYLLVKTSEIGGEMEKIVPLNNCDYIDQEERQWSFMCSDDVPACYMIEQPELKPIPKEVELFLTETTSGQLDANWLNYCRELFRKCLTDETNTELKSKWFGDLLYYAMEAQEQLGPVVESTANEKALAPADETEVVSDFLFNGCQLAIRYGVRLKILNDDEKVIDDLMEVLSDLHSSQKIEGFDWFTATVFLLLCGNSTKTYVFMKHVSALGIDLWLVGSKLNNPESWISFCHSVEIVMDKELPLVTNALKWSGLSIGQVCQLWVGQCFWNILNWEEICQYIGLCLLFGQDFQVYCMVAIFKYSQKQILEHSQREDLSIFLKETRLNGFLFKNYLFFMDYLESKYKDLLHSTMDTGNLCSLFTT